MEQDLAISKQLTEDGEYILNPINLGYDRRVDDFLARRKDFIRSLVLKKKPITGAITKKAITEHNKKELSKDYKRIDTEHYESIDRFVNQYQEQKKKAMKEAGYIISEALSTEKKEEVASNWATVSNVSAMFRILSSDKDDRTDTDKKDKQRETTENVERKLSLQFLYGAIKTEHTPQSLISLLFNNIPVEAILDVGVTMTNFVEAESITFYTFLVNGYTLHDMILLGLTWKYLQALRFNYLVWREFKKQVPVDLLVTYFSCSMEDMFYSVFFYDIYHICEMDFTVDELRIMDCTASFLQSRNLTNDQIKRFKISKEDWTTKLGANKDTLRLLG